MNSLEEFEKYEKYEKYEDLEFDNELYHYGMPRRSGRYPFGSGENPYQHCGEFLKQVNTMRKANKSEKQIAEALGMTPSQYGKSLATTAGPELLKIKDYYAQKLGTKDTTVIAKELGMSSTEFRSAITLAKAQQMQNNKRTALKLVNEKKYSQTKAAEIMGVNESTLRSYLKEDYGAKNDLDATVETIRKNVEKFGYVDVGKGVETELGITQEKKKAAIKYLVNKYGYYSGTIQVPQATNPAKKTNIDLIAKKGTTYKDAKANLDKVHSIQEYSTDNGKTFFGIEYPTSVDSKRILIKYDEDHGTDKDGVIELRRGVDDLSLGGSSYAQVRIAVDDNLYAKGMAIYSDNIPDGYDIVINSNKKQGTPLNKVLKEMKTVDVKDENGNVVLDKNGEPKKEINKDNPFGAVIKARGQTFYKDSKGTYVKVDDDNYKKADNSTPKDAERYSLSCVNKIKEEGDWEKYSTTLSSQFLSKQRIELIEKQLDMTKADKEAEFKEICSIEVPEVRKKMLWDYAEQCDADSYKLKASALPGQTSKVILPVTSLRDDECYAPTYKDGTQLALIRYPHAGLFEIPIVTVNNNNKEGKTTVGPSSQDAIGINPTVASQLSGADFDGDTVMAIPTNTRTGVKISNQAPLEGLKNFNTKIYAFSEEELANGAEVMTAANKQKEMGMISNLITDMTLRGNATNEELERAVKHSMVVIDAEKHKLNYKQSFIDNNIQELKIKYQGNIDPETGRLKTGAGTLISRAKSETNVAQKKEGAYIDGYKSKQFIDPKTGAKLYTETGDSYTKYWVMAPNKSTKSGYKKTEVYSRYDGTYVTKDKRKFTEKDIIDSKVIGRTTKSVKLAETNDATTLISDANTVQERAYADYSNYMKDLGNRARLEYLHTENTKVDPTAAKTYAKEVASLKYKLNEAYKNAPRERIAQVRAYAAIEKMKETDSSLEDKENLKRARQQAIAQARSQAGAKSKDSRIRINENEWKAIRANAVNSTTLTEIIKNTDEKVLRELATPREKTALSDTKVAQIKAYRASGYTIAQIAEALNLSTSTVSNYSKD